VLRNRPRPVKQGTPLQLERRAMMMKLHAAWSNLTSDQRQKWNQYISFASPTTNRDKSILLTGHDLFLKYNYLRLLYNLSVLTEPAYQLPVQLPQVRDVTDDAGWLDLWLTDAYFTWTYWKPIVRISPPRRESQAFSTVRLKYIGVPDYLASTIQYRNKYVNLFGMPLSDGDIVHIELKYFNTLAPIISQTFKYILPVAVF
jgi:hypothetical protein